MCATCSKTLSQRVATYNQRIVAEGDSLGEEVRLCDIQLLGKLMAVPAALTVNSVQLAS